MYKNDPLKVVVTSKGENANVVYEAADFYLLDRSPS